MLAPPVRTAARTAAGKVQPGSQETARRLRGRPSRGALRTLWARSAPRPRQRGGGRTGPSQPKRCCWGSLLPHTYIPRQVWTRVFFCWILIHGGCGSLWVQKHVVGGILFNKQGSHPWMPAVTTDPCNDGRAPALLLWSFTPPHCQCAEAITALLSQRQNGLLVEGVPGFGCSAGGAGWVCRPE